ncbi:hypothetical protein GOP47_0005847, partial [Adiantum capillus-veneris]
KHLCVLLISFPFSPSILHSPLLRSTSGIREQGAHRHPRLCPTCAATPRESMRAQQGQQTENRILQGKEGLLQAEKGIERSVRSPPWKAKKSKIRASRGARELSSAEHRRQVSKQRQVES